MDTDTVHAGRITPFLVLSCIVASSGGLLYGYDLGISGGVTSMGSFLNEFFPNIYNRLKETSRVSNYCKFNSQLLTLFTSSLYLAGLVSSLFASSITRKFGHQTSILVGGAVFFAGVAAGGAAVNIYMLILSRVLLGFGVGFTNQSIPLYLSELAPPKYRGAMNTAFGLCISFGILFANLINYGVQRTRARWGWRISLSLAAVPAFFLTIGAFFLPATPNSVIQRTGDVDEAKKLLQRIRGTADVKEELDGIVYASNYSRTIRRPFQKIMERRYRPQLIMTILLPFFQQFSGVNVINFYAPVMFRTIGFEDSASLMSSVVTRVVATAFNIIGMTLVDNVGRRKLYLSGGVVMFLSHMAVGGLLAAKLKDHGAMDRDYGYLALASICVFLAGFALSWGPLTWLVTSEIFPLEVRSTGQGIAVAVDLFATFVIGQSFLVVLCHLKAATFFVFGGWVVAMTLFVYLLLPETRGLPIEQAERVWKKHWFWKRYVGEESSSQENGSTK